MNKHGNDGKGVSGRGGSRVAPKSKMERFVIIVNGFQPLTVITKRSILDVAAVLDQPLSGVAIFSVRESGLLFGVILEIYLLICEIAAKICDCFTAFISFNLLV